MGVPTPRRRARGDRTGRWGREQRERRRAKPTAGPPRPRPAHPPPRAARGRPRRAGPCPHPSSRQRRRSVWPVARGTPAAAVRRPTRGAAASAGRGADTRPAGSGTRRASARADPSPPPRLRRARHEIVQRAAGPLSTHATSMGGRAPRSTRGRGEHGRRWRRWQAEASGTGGSGGRPEGERSTTGRRWKGAAWPPGAVSFVRTLVAGAWRMDAVPTYVGHGIAVAGVGPPTPRGCLNSDCTRISQ